MSQIWAVVGSAVGLLSQAQDFPVRFSESVQGESVRVSIDGGPAHSTVAGKLFFQDARHSWQSVCADVRSPVSQGQVFTVRPLRSQRVGRNYGRAGNIVAKYFNLARTAEQCAGLQLAVWEVIEDGGTQPDFSSGRFRAQASAGALAYAQQYYGAAGQKGDAVLLAATQSGGQGGGQSQLSAL